jgi:hypothetical protein
MHWLCTLVVLNCCYEASGRLHLKCDGTRAETRFVFRQNGQVYLNWRGRQFSRLLAAEVCASTVVMLDTPCSEVVWRVLATHSICQLPLHFPFRASPCAITFQLDSTCANPCDKRGMRVHDAYASNFVIVCVVICILFQSRFWLSWLECGALDVTPPPI